MILGYARVSKSDDQDTLTQVKALKKAGAKKIFEDKASGGRLPELRQPENRGVSADANPSLPKSSAKKSSVWSSQAEILHLKPPEFSMYTLLRFRGF